jgi:hypothetical protein
MAVNTIPLSSGKAYSKTVNVSTAKTDTSEVASPSDGADFRLLYTAGANGGHYDGIQIQWIGTGTQALHVIDVWETETDGSDARVVFSQQITAMAAAISNTNPGSAFFIPFPFGNLQTGKKIFISSRVVSTNCTMNATLRGGQFEAQ